MTEGIQRIDENRTEPWDALTFRGGELRTNQQRESTVSEEGGKSRELPWKPGKERSQARGND